MLKFLEMQKSFLPIVPARYEDDEEVNRLYVRFICNNIEGYAEMSYSWYFSKCSLVWGDKTYVYDDDGEDIKRFSNLGPEDSGLVQELRSFGFRIE